MKEVALDIKLECLSAYLNGTHHSQDSGSILEEMVIKMKEPGQCGECVQCCLLGMVQASQA